ncbi:MAG: CPBP family intramembrane metalloprotease [Clostridiales bacterium]|nr:CPBP family intramembrane metalloprotease [Clostridiales bacterium]
MKKIAITTVKFIGFFLGWAILISVLPIPSSEVPAIWRLWAEVEPLLAIIIFTLIFWLLEKKRVELHLLNHPVRGTTLGLLAGIVWLGVPVVIMYIAKIIHFEGMNAMDLFGVWVLAAFCNVIMQELLVRGYLYQMMKRNYNTGIAAIVTTMLFTALHGGAFEAGIVPVMNVLTMSLLMTIILEYSGSIIAPTIMHFLWNGIGALIIGGVSLADDYPSLMVTTFTGNVFWSGGECKIEGSSIVLFTNIILIAFFGLLLNRRDKCAR